MEADQPLGEILNRVGDIGLLPMTAGRGVACAGRSISTQEPAKVLHSGLMPEFSSNARPEMNADDAVCARTISST